MNRVLILFLCSTLSLTLSARRGRVAPVVAEKKEQSAPSVRDADVDRHVGRYRDVDLLVEKAKRDAESVQRRAERDAQELAGKVRQKQSRLERRRQELLNKDAREVMHLEAQSKKDAEELKKEAEEKAARILQEAEQKAEELRRLKEMEDRSDREKYRPVITKEWRREVTRDCENDVAFLRQIVVEGEVSRNERQNFVTLFNDQLAWARDMIEKTKYFFDEQYAAVMEKRNAMAALVDAQRQADDIILDLVEQHHFSAQVHAQLRLMALYELNNHLNNNTSEHVFLNADVIRNLVTRLGNDYAPGAREIKIVSERERIAELERTIAELESKVEIENEVTELKREIARREDEHDEEVAAIKASMQERIEQMREADLYSLQSQLNVLQKEKEYLEGKAERQARDHAYERSELVSLIEKKQKEYLALELSLAKTSEHLRQLSHESYEHVSDLSQSLEERGMVNDALVKAIELKTKEQIELELAVSKAREQLKWLTSSSHEALRALKDEVVIYQEQCQELAGQLRLKQEEAVSRDIAIESMRNKMEALSELKGAAEEHCGDLQEQLLSVVDDAEKHVSQLIGTLQSQQEELARKEGVYEEMRGLQQKIEELRASRAQDAKRDAAYTTLLSQMASFGSMILKQYGQTHDMQREAESLVGDVAIVRDKVAAGDSEGALADITTMLATLSSMPTLEKDQPTIGVGCDRFAPAPGESDGTEEREAVHEPDEKPETPKPVDGDGGDDVVAIDTTGDTQTKKRRTRRKNKF